MPAGQEDRIKYVSRRRKIKCRTGRGENRVSADERRQRNVGRRKKKNKSAGRRGGKNKMLIDEEGKQNAFSGGEGDEMLTGEEEK